jgi:PAS domain S-box-containing protein
MSISSNVREFLGYTNSELKDQSINKLIPRIYHTIHDTIIDNILDKPDAEIVTTQYRIFPVNSEGYIIECNITSKFMPSVTCGINIVSFIEQCDVYKDEFFIIYDKVTGMVDSMNEGAEKMLKDASRRKTSEMLAIPDHINDLVPNWDYKNEIWREHIGRGKSSKSINSMNEFKYDVKEIEVLRSDGLESKFIKILKFKGDFFVRMFSFDNNYDSYKESNTIQQYLEYQKDNTYSKMDSNQLEDLISIETHHLIDRNQEKKKTIQKMEKI